MADNKKKQFSIEEVNALAAMNQLPGATNVTQNTTPTTPIPVMQELQSYITQFGQKLPANFDKKIKDIELQEQGIAGNEADNKKKQFSIEEVNALAAMNQLPTDEEETLPTNVTQNTTSTMSAPVMQDVQSSSTNVQAGTQTTTQFGQKLPADFDKKIKDIELQEQGIAGNEAELQQKKAKIAEDKSIIIKKAEEDLFAKQAEEQAAFEAAQQRTEEAYNTAKDELKIAGGKKVNQEEFWKNRGGTFGKLAAALLAGIYEYAKPNANVNVPLQIINGAIEDDIKRQQKEIDDAVANKKDLVNLANNDIAKLTTKFKDRQLATEAVRDALIRKAEAEFNENMSKLMGSNEVALLNIGKADAQQKKEALDREMKKAELTQNRVTETKTSGGKSTTTVKSAPVKSDGYKDAGERTNVAMKLRKEYEDSTKKYIDSKNELDQLNGLLIEAENGNEAAAKSIKVLLGKISQSGVLSDKDFTRSQAPMSIFRRAKNWISENMTGKLTKDDMKELKVINNMYSDIYDEKIGKHVNQAAIWSSRANIPLIEVVPVDHLQYSQRLAARKKKK